MAWFNADDKMHSHPKMRAAGLEAIGLWTLAGTYCTDYLTDGAVPAWFVDSWPKGKQLAAKLVKAGLWGGRTATTAAKPTTHPTERRQPNEPAPHLRHTPHPPHANPTPPGKSAGAAESNSTPTKTTPPTAATAADI